MKIILAIDDQQDNLTTIQTVIRSHIPNCRVLTSRSGKEGIKLAQQEQPDTILLDIIMPQMDGYETCKNLKENKLTKHIPVVMVTAIRTDSESRVKGLNNGADAFLSKPIDPIELSAQVGVMLRIKEAEDKLREDKDLLEDKIIEKTTELKESEEKYKALYDNAPLSYQSLNNNGNFLDVNPTWLATLGYEKNEVIGKCFSELLHPDWKSHFDENFAAFKERGYASDVQYKIKHKEGHFLDISFEGCAGYDINGNFKHSYCTFQDITKRKKTEEALTESQRQLKLIIDKIPGMLAYLNSDEKYLYVNKAYADTYKLSQEKFPGKKLKEIIPSDIYNNAKDKIKLVLSGKEIIYENKVAIDTAERKNWLVKYIPHFDNKGKVIAYLTIVDDITDRKRAEEDLTKALNKAQESDRLKSAFLANMSHEIRTPMNGILGFAGLLKEHNLTNEKQQEYIDIIENSGDRMLNLINDLIDISRLEADQMAVTISETNINKKLEDLYTFFKHEVEQKGIQLSYNINLINEKATIQTDNDKLYAILTNLIKNAIKYTDKGSIEFGYTSACSATSTSACSATSTSAKSVTTHSVNEPIELKFYVKDTGIGIPKDRHKAVFDRFVQADIEDIEVREGAGLGLSISKAYVEMLGGRIWLESEQGKGSQLYFTIPYSKKSPKLKRTKLSNDTQEKTDNQKNLNILIAEDDEMANIFLTEILSDKSEKILYAKTGKETVELFKENKDIDLILMDIKMPDMNGYDATRMIRKFNTDVIIIAQTGYAISGDREKALEAGCDEYISKPIDRGELMEKINRLMSGGE